MVQERRLQTDVPVEARVEQQVDILHSVVLCSDTDRDYGKEMAVQFSTYRMHSKYRLFLQPQL